MSFFLKRQISAIMVLAGGVLLGIISMGRLDFTLLPSTAKPGITVITRYSGHSALTIEDIITRRIEDKISSIEGIEKIESVSKDGESRIHVVFFRSVDADQVSLEVQEAIDLVYPLFPTDVEYPSIVPFNPNEQPVFIVSFSSEKYDLKKLRSVIDQDVKPQFNRIKGISEVFVGGGFVREIQILPDINKLIHYGLNFSTLAQIIQSNNIFRKAGELEEDGEVNTVLHMDKLTEVDQIKDVFFSGGNEALIFLSDVAEVKDHYRERDSISRTDQKEKVSIYVQKSGIGNAVQLTRECRQILEKLELDDIEYNIEYDQGEEIQESLNRVITSVLTGAVIAVLVLYFFLQDLILILSAVFNISFSVLTAMFFLFVLKIEMNALILSGIALGTGMLIDNTIVITEKQNFFSQGNKLSAENILKAVRSVWKEIVSSTLTTVIIFLPFMLVESESGIIYRNVSISIFILLGLSLISSLTIMPALTLHFSHGIKNPHLQFPFLKRFTSVHWQKKIEQYVVFVQNLFLKQWKLTTLVFSLILLLSIFAFANGKKEFIQPGRGDTIYASLEFISGTPLQKTDEKTVKLTESLQKHKYVKKISSKIEKWHTSLTIELNPRTTSGKSYLQIVKELRKVTDPFRDISTIYSEESGREINIHFFGDDIKQLKDFVYALAPKMSARGSFIDGIVFRFKEGKPAFHLIPEKTVLHRSGITLADAGNTVKNSLYGSVVDKFYDGTNEVDIRTRLPENETKTYKDFSRSFFPYSTESPVPLSSLVDFVETSEESNVYRKNRQRMVSMTVKLGNIDTGSAGKRIIEWFSSGDEDFILPEGMRYSLGEEYQKILESENELFFLISIASLLVFAVLASLYESLRLPILIFLVVPASLSIPAIVLFFSGNSFNVSVYLGFILTAGISVNSSILVVSSIHHHSTQDFASIIESTRERIRPVLMTTITTVFGMLPLLFDPSQKSSFWKPMAITVISGILTSALFSLMVIPLLYQSMKKWLEKD